MPDLGDVGEVSIVEWLKQPGDMLQEGEDLIEVETEKTTFVVSAPASGRLERIVVADGGRARVGEALGEIKRTS